MESWNVVKDVVILLAAAVAVGLVFERMRISAMLGYLVAGIIVGPSALHLVPRNSVELAAEVGVALLLFTIGLETSWSRFRSMGSMAAGGGSLQVLLTSLAVAGAGLLFGVDWRAALVIGFAVSMSSTATVLQSLQARGEQDSRHGRSALGVLLVQDGAVVPLVLLTSFLARGGTASEMVEGLSLAAGKALLLVLVLIFIGARLMPRLLTAAALARTRELPILLAVVSCLAAAFAAQEAGLSAAMGAFIAGMVLADSPLATQMRSDVNPIRAVLVTLFFASVGMQADLHWLVVWPHPLWVGLIVLMVIVVKTAITAGVLRLFGAGRAVALAAGICLAQIGEFSFVLASEARSSGLFDLNAFQCVVSATLVTLLLTPLLVAKARPIARRLARADSHTVHEADEAAGGHAGGPHILLVGYGPAGREVVEQLKEVDLPITVIDTNPRSAMAAAAEGRRAVTGDATRAEVLEHAGLETAVACVIAIPDHYAARLIMAECRALRPGMPLIARARYHKHVGQLGAVADETVVDEEEAVGRLLGFEAYMAIEGRKTEAPQSE